MVLVAITYQYFSFNRLLLECSTVLFKMLWSISVYEKPLFTKAPFGIYLKKDWYAYIYPLPLLSCTQTHKWHLTLICNDSTIFCLWQALVKARRQWVRYAQCHIRVVLITSGSTQGDSQPTQHVIHRHDKKSNYYQAIGKLKAGHIIMHYICICIK